MFKLIVNETAYSTLKCNTWESDFFRGFKIKTEKRLEILHVIKGKQPSSIYELAKILQRDLTNVIDDINYLNKLGLVSLKKCNKGKEKTIPTVDFNKILLEIGV